MATKQRLSPQAVIIITSGSTLGTVKEPLRPRYEARGFITSLSSSLLEIDGASDHGVSEAIYFRDPDQNGIELYRDRPESEWPRDANGNLEMVSEPLDLEELLTELD